MRRLPDRPPDSFLLGVRRAARAGVILAYLEARGEPVSAKIRRLLVEPIPADDLPTAEVSEGWHLPRDTATG